jgi:tRNA modification GTPase
LVSNLRHIEALKKTEKLVVGSLNSLDNKLSLEFIAQDLKEALSNLDDILGRRFSEDLLDKIFSEFCIGK